MSGHACMCMLDAGGYGEWGDEFFYCGLNCEKVIFCLLCWIDFDRILGVHVKNIQKQSIVPLPLSTFNPSHTDHHSITICVQLNLQLLTTRL